MSGARLFLSFVATAAVLLPTIAAAQCAHSRGLAVGSQRQEASGEALGLRATLDRPQPVYAIGEQLTLTISINREATIELWELDAHGSLTKLLPATGQTLSVGPGRPLKLPARGQSFDVGGPAGVNELHVIARAALPTRTRDLGADRSLARNDLRQEVRLCYTVVAS
jgi:hypothetical protein